MELIVSHYPESIIRGIIKYASYINKEYTVDYMRDLIQMPMGAVTIYMFYVIHLCILYYVVPKSVLYWKVC